MNIDPSLVPKLLHGIAACCMLGLIALAAWQAPWGALRRVPNRQHLLFGALVALLLLWSLRIEIAPGIWIHLLGMTTLTVLVGWPLAILGGSLALTIFIAGSSLALTALPLSWVLTVGLPASISRLAVSLMRRFGAPNPYVFLLGAGFGGGLASIVAVACASLLVLSLAGVVELSPTLRSHVPMLALTAFPEGFINGVVVTAITVVNPDWVKTFDEKFYTRYR